MVGLPDAGLEGIPPPLIGKWYSVRYNEMIHGRKREF